MPEANMTALTEFGKTVVGSISATDVLSILGTAVAGGMTIYLVIWGGKKIVKVFSRALNGKIGV